jgi:hypothetical protein
MQLTLPQIEVKVREFTDIINAPEDLIPTFGYSKESGLPHVEIYDDTYHLVVSEGGKQVSKKSTKDPDELLFMLMHTITLSMACERIFIDTNYQSLRLRLFQVQKNIISKINLSYTNKIKIKQDTMQNELVMS